MNRSASVNSSVIFMLILLWLFFCLLFLIRDDCLEQCRGETSQLGVPVHHDHLDAKISQIPARRALTAVPLIAIV